MILCLPFSLPDATPIGDRYAMQTRDGFTYYFFNLEPFDCHPADDRRAMLLRAAKLHVVSGVPQADIMAAFHLSRPTVARAVKRYRERGEDAFFEPRRGRGRTVVDARMADEAAKLLASGISGSACARQLGIPVSTFNENRRAGVIADPTRAPAAGADVRRRLRPPITPPARTLDRPTRLRLPIVPPATPATSKRPWAARLVSRLATARNRLAEALQEHHRDTATRLEADANALAAELDQLKQQRAHTLTHVHAGDLPEQDKLDALPVGGRLFLDLVRMIAYRAETRMMAPVITTQGKKPNARRLLRALLTSDANIIPVPAQGILCIQLLGLGSDACDRMLAPLVEELNATRTIYPGTDLRLVYELAGDPPPEVSPDSG